MGGGGKGSIFLFMIDIIDIEIRMNMIGIIPICTHMIDISFFCK